MLALDIITIGFPFCAFKIIAGLYFGQYWLVGLGIVDILLNLINLITLTTHQKAVTDVCLLSLIVRKIKQPVREAKHKWQDLGNALDVCLSFAIVALVIGGGHTPNLPMNHLIIWNVGVIFNVFGAGVSRLTYSLKNLN